MIYSKKIRMRRIFLYAVVSCMLIVFPDDETSALLPPEHYRQDLLQACTLIANNYIYLEDKLNISRNDFQQECLQWVQEMSFSTNPKQVFIHGIRQLRSRFADGHFDWQLDKSLLDLAQIGATSYRTLGLVLTTQGDKLVVAKVYPEDGLDEIQAGDQIVTWNGRDAQNALTHMCQFAPQSTAASSLEVAARNLTLHTFKTPYRDQLSPVSCSYQNRDGDIRQLTLSWKSRDLTVSRWRSDKILLTRNLWLSLEELPATSDSLSNSLPFYVLDVETHRIVVLHPRDFMSWNASDLERTMHRILQEQPDYVLIDLKDTAGGGFQSVLALAHALDVRQQFAFLYHGIDPETGIELHEQQNFDWIARDIHIQNVWQGKVLFRTNALCGSGCDFFIRWMQLQGRGDILGTPTAGRGGGTNDFYLSHTQTRLSFPVRDRILVGDSHSLEEHPVLPDVFCEKQLHSCLKQYFQHK